MLEQKLKKPERLVVIGNGADLHCGLESSFSDFMIETYGDSLDPNSNSRKSLDLQDKLNREVLSRIEVKEAIDNISDLENLLPPVAHCNLWAAWLLSLRVDDDPQNNWSDVESSIARVLSNEIIIDVLNGKASGFTSGHPNMAKCDYYFLVLLYVYKRSGTGLWDVLHTQLTKYEKGLADYLQQLININESYPRNVSALLNSLITAPNGLFSKRPEYATLVNFSLLNFNYINTGTILNAYTSSRVLPRLLNQRNVHGLINTHPIIGIDSTEIDAQSPIISFGKTYRSLEISNSFDEKMRERILDPNIKSIAFYGHSLSLNDYAYFQSIFDYYNIYENPISLFFYYSVYSKSHKEEIKSMQLTRITQLMQRYGHTLTNEGHGKNLLHKLILDDRIHISVI